MRLKDLIEALSVLPPGAMVKNGFGPAGSYRGYYDQIAFEPVEEAMIGDMLKYAEKAMGETYSGYKGGEYTMNGYTECWIAEWGRSVDYPIHPAEVREWARQALP